MIYSDYAAICKALGDNTRVEIFDMLKVGSMCACKILEKFVITQPTLSYHMNLLADCQLVNVQKQGKWNHYSINCHTLEQLTNFLQKNISN